MGWTLLNILLYLSYLYVCCRPTRVPVSGGLEVSHIMKCFAVSLGRIVPQEKELLLLKMSWMNWLGLSRMKIHKIWAWILWKWNTKPPLLPPILKEPVRKERGGAPTIWMNFEKLP
ncbi:hypothetical protein AAC387_Pa02g2662 [Persea americana]